mgnify:CR=1 FL=1
MSIKDINDKLMKAGFIPSIINELTNDELEEMLKDSIIEMWEGNRYLVQRVTKHKPVTNNPKRYGPAFMWMSCIDLNSCEKVRLRVRYWGMPSKNTPQNWSINEWVDKSVWKVGEQRLYVKEWSNA